MLSVYGCFLLKNPPVQHHPCGHHQRLPYLRLSLQPLPHQVHLHWLTELALLSRYTSVYDFTLNQSIKYSKQVLLVFILYFNQLEWNSGGVEALDVLTYLDNVSGF